MAEQTSTQSPRDRAQDSSQAVFQQAWHIYRVLVDENYLFHREAYACLHHILRAEIDRPFHFLDVACGDATASVGALEGTAIAKYSGIDLSTAALALARQTLAALDCPVTLEQADFVERLPTWSVPVDVVWVGLSLHHLQAPEKLAVMRAIRAILPRDGRFLFYDNTSPDDEARVGDDWAMTRASRL
ncbi:MAG: class I SAM-dependent methyltransferase [Thermomicrobiales bacterium]